MIIDIDEYDKLNEKLYKKGNADTLTNDPIEIAKSYQDAGVDISRYSCKDLVEAHEAYNDYAYKAKSSEVSLRETIRLENELSNKLEWERKEAERRAYYDELDRMHEEYIQDLIDNGEYIGDYTDDVKRYLEICCDYKDELFEYLRSKGAYKDDDVTSTGLYGRIRFDCEHDRACTYDERLNYYKYGFVCDVEKFIYYDLDYFDFDEWEVFNNEVQFRKDILKEFETLKSYQLKKAEDINVEEYARKRFMNVRKNLNDFKKTGLRQNSIDTDLGYKAARKLAFNNDPKTICEIIGKVIRSVLN